MAPVILKMDVHCKRCARKIRQAIEKMFGVERVWASLDTGLVVIAGTADALAIRRRLRRKTGKSVTIVSDGTPAPQLPSAEDVPFVGMTHLAPPPGYPPYYTWAATPPLPPAPYVAAPAPAPAGYLYAGNPWAPTQNQYQYVPGGTPTRFVDDDDDDDDDTSDGCCSVQ